MSLGNMIPKELQSLYSDSHTRIEILDKVRLIWCKHLHSDLIESDKFFITFVNMMVLKGLSLLKIFDGVRIPTCEKDILVVDTESAFTLLRSIYEETIVFRNLFVYPQTDIEKRILINIWKIKGLLNRQNLANMSQTYMEKVEKEAEDISRLITEIHELPIQVINQSGIKAIDEYLNLNKGKNTLFAGYVFEKDGTVISGGKSVSFTSAPKEFLHSEELNVVLYRLLSLHSHPSYISVLQFQEVRPNNDYWDYAITILRGFYLMINIFISDFCTCKNLEVNCNSNEIRVYQK